MRNLFLECTGQGQKYAQQPRNQVSGLVIFSVIQGTYINHSAHSSHIYHKTNLVDQGNPGAYCQWCQCHGSSLDLWLAEHSCTRVNTERIIVYFITSYRIGLSHWLLLEVTKEEKKLSRSWFIYKRNWVVLDLYKRNWVVLDLYIRMMENAY